MKILLAGGGSGGPVTPVLAVALEIKKLKPKTEFLFVGTKKGPERGMVEPTGIPFVLIPAAKWRRYITVSNLFSPFILFFAFVKSLFIIRKFHPDVMFTAGSFVGVPVAWAAKICGIPVVMHQQDARIGLANKMVTPFATQITTAFELTSKEFYSGSGLFDKKLRPAAEWVGNPVRPDFVNSPVDAKKYFNLHDELPVLLILGGATGAVQINNLVEKILPDLVKAHQVIHQTGKGKNNITFKDRNYHSYELIPFPEYSAIFKLAHIIIARAGLSTLAELSAMGKVAIIIPMPGTHQEDNATVLEVMHAAVILSGTDATAENLSRVINALKFNLKHCEILSKNMASLMPKNAAENIAKLIIKHANGKQAA